MHNYFCSKSILLVWIIIVLLFTKGNDIIQLDKEFDFGEGIEIYIAAQEHFDASQWRHNERDGVSPALRLFAKPFIQAQIKEDVKVPRHWPLWREFTGDRWIPRTKGQ